MAPTQVIRQVLVEEQQHLDELLRRFESTLTDPSTAATAAAFAALARGVRGQLRREDEVVLAALTGEIGDVATASMRREHAPVRALLAEIEHGLRHAGGAGVLGTTRELAAALALHHRRLASLVPAEPAPPAP